MYLYNISIIVEDSQHDTLLNWLEKEWLPSLVQEIKFLKMINTPHEGHTYCVQMTVNNQEDIVNFQQTTLNDLQYHLQLNHKEKAFIFDSIMQYL
ncbi:DUF4286 family protein [Sphingobacterium rhinopitheci]|uniref:DUF4286 family protein n=1 Tax=Sphingobacterium rhinopitheci TaxID=2781960 RepID=UPI001F528A50|nr:DUF4286 family protein [Sphingobacterium rhinopitheci]MCI0920240.1 DUF4286 family protein [Sphingobacterium rhinopitheci]